MAHDCDTHNLVMILNDYLCRVIASLAGRTTASVLVSDWMRPRIPRDHEPTSNCTWRPGTEHRSAVGPIVKKSNLIGYNLQRLILLRPGYHYAIELRLANPVEAARYVYGKLDFTLKGIKGLIDNAALTSRYSTFTFIEPASFYTESNIG